MQPVNGIDVIEQDIADYSYPLLDILLIDRTTKKNIIWASDDYAYLGEAYETHKHIYPNLIIGNHTKLIQPRTAKTQTDQINRTRNKAEVFTPSWICNAQNNLVDEAWFGRKDVFNTPNGTNWEDTVGAISFPKDKKHTWQAYVDANRMEISCGEAPYLVSRYDSTTGKMIALESRIGLLDRKLRIVNENTSSEEEWLKWTQRAFQSVYAYEFQGDNLLLARENLLYTFIDNMRFKLQREPAIRELKTIATIISWNIWQMDGIKCTIPYREPNEITNQMSMIEFFGSEPSEDFYDEGVSVLCKIKDWRSKTIMEYKSLLEGAK